VDENNKYDTTLNKRLIRLSQEEIQAIKITAQKIFGSKSKVWIFGSRVKPELKGGDIDIYIEIPKMQNWLEKKIDFLVKLKEIIGEQRIDVIIKPLNCNEPICLEAKGTGVEL
jgi:predicted nucleotidyltransferase